MIQKISKRLLRTNKKSKSIGPTNHIRNWKDFCATTDLGTRSFVCFLVVCVFHLSNTKIRQSSFSLHREYQACMMQLCILLTSSSCVVMVAWEFLANITTCLMNYFWRLRQQHALFMTQAGPKANILFLEKHLNFKCNHICNQNAFLYDSVCQFASACATP